MDTEEYIALVYKNLKGIATPLEFQQLNTLSAGDEKLASLRLDIEDAWDLSGDIPNVVSKEDTLSLINKIKGKGGKTIDLEKNIKVEKKTVSLKRMLASIAAVFVLVVGSFWLLRDQTKIYNKAGEYVLADNSIITLREGSSLKVMPFDDSQRRVELFGEAYFEIAQDAARPFIVSSQNAKITVLGTSFLVKEKGDETFIDLVEGRVSVLDSRSLSNNIMTAGMRVRLDTKGQFNPEIKYNNLVSWKTGIIEYENVELSNVLEEIALIFGSPVELANQSLKGCIFSAILSDDNIKDILTRIANKFDMNVSQVNNKWILSGGQCK